MIGRGIMDVQQLFALIQAPWPPSKKLLRSKPEAVRARQPSDKSTKHLGTWTPRGDLRLQLVSCRNTPIGYLFPLLLPDERAQKSHAEHI